jgi:hypothetical protein
MTYNETERIQELGQARKFDMELVPMKSTHHAEMAELLLGRNLNWARA